MNDEKYKKIKDAYNIENKLNMTLDSVLNIFHIFRKEMGYDLNGQWKYINVNDTVQYCLFTYKIDNKKLENLLVECTINSINKTMIDNFLQELQSREIEWGMITNGNQFMLFNKDIKSVDGWKWNPILLEITMKGEYGKEYFDFLLCDNIFVKKKSLLLCDILYFRNQSFNGTEDSWKSYNSSCKRYIKYISSKISKYETKIYDTLTIDDFINFINSVKDKNGRSIKSKKSIINMYRHISTFMKFISEKNKEFYTNINDVLNNFSDYKQKTIGNIFQEEYLEQVVCHIKTQRYGKRNLVIFYLCLCLGLERNKLCQLKWEHREGDTIKIDGKDKIVPVYVNKLLDELYEENRKRNLPLDYIFYTFKGEKGVPIKPGTINDIFTNIGKIDLDNKIFSQYDPANIRKALAEYLFVEQHMDLADVLYFLDIDVNNANSYITNEMIQNMLNKNNCRKNNELLDNLIKKIDNDY